MPVKAIAKASIARNGIGAYIVPCHKISLHYCNWGGSSSGIRSYIQSRHIENIAKDKSNIFFEVIKRVGHPSLKFHYNNDVVKEVNIANMDTEAIHKQIKEHSQSSGADLLKFNHKVMSVNDSIRGIWSPMHTPKSHRFRI